MTKVIDSETSDSDIAVIATSAHFPGADDVETFWANLRDGVESIRTFADHELQAAGVDDATLRHPNYVKAGAILDGVDMFDAGFFGVSPKDAAIMDPQHRHFLEVCWEALERAGCVPERFGGQIAVYGGCGMNAYFMMNILTNPDLVRDVGMFLLRHTGNDKDFLSTLVSYKLNLTGPSVNVQTACSTSLVAIHMACQSLLNGECDLALAGGSTINIPHQTGYLYEEGEILAPDGHCRAFDADAKGTVFGSGAGVVVLRRLTDALADGDPILAVIKGSAINNDGAMKAGYLAPSVDGQAKAIAEAIAIAGIRADQIGYVETHGTGTPVGDPIEITALTQAFRQTTDLSQYCAIGSTKPNIGHLDTAAGVASFIKVVEALRHRQLPPSLWFRRANPAIEFERTPFVVNHELRAWEADRPLHAGVSSLGVGGTNAHIVLSAAPARAASAASRPQQLLVLSSKSKTALENTSRRLADFLEREPDTNLADVAYTLLRGRSEFPVRRVLAVQDVREAISMLRAPDARRVFDYTQPAGLRPGTHTVTFMLPGGGAQYPNMARGLYATEPVFRKWVDAGLDRLRDMLDTDVRGVWFPREGADVRALERPSLQLPTIFVLEHALAQLWMSWGIRPTALIGHSLGENTAACIAGVLSFHDALGLVVLRGRLFERLAPGAMVSVALPVGEVETMLQGGLGIATINAPSLTVVSGPLAAIEAFERDLVVRQVEHQRVRINIAAHSAMLEPILDEFGRYLRGVELHPPSIPIISNVTGTWLSDDQATDPGYWVQHLRSTVRFADGLATLAEDAQRIFLEVGPGKTLTSLARQHDRVGPRRTVLSSLRHAEEVVDDLAFTLTVLGRLWQHGVQPDWDAFYADEVRLKVTLPAGALDRQRYWIEPGRSRHEDLPSPPKLSKLESLDQWFNRVVWEPTPLPSAASRASQRVLLFIDGSGLGAALATVLVAKGHEVICVREGDAFFRFDDHHYALAPESGRVGYDALIADLAQREIVIDRIVHLWTVTADESHRPGSSYFHHVQERGFYSLLYLAQALGADGQTTPLHIDFVTNGMQAVADEPVTSPEKATSLGPIRVIPNEFPNVTCRAIDIVLPVRGEARWFGRKPRDVGFEALSTQLLSEFDGASANEIVAWRSGVRYLETHRPHQLRPLAHADETWLRDGMTVMLTGGLGGIGLHVLEHLAEEWNLKFVVLTRSKLPERAVWDAWLARHGDRDPTSAKIHRLREIEARGSELMVISVDVADIDAMRNAMREVGKHFGPVHALVHAAGVMEDEVIQLKHEDSIERVFTPKVHGTLVLSEVLRDQPLELCILFSSTSAFLGAAGQVDYTGANAFLSAFANADRFGPKCRVTAIDWGVWREVGMAFGLSRRLLGDDEVASVRERTVHPLFDERWSGRPGERVVAGLLRPQQWLLDEHRMVDGRPIVPGTGYVEIVRAAQREVGGASTCEICDLTFIEALEVGDAGVELRVHLRDGEGETGFELCSRGAQGSGEWQVHAQGSVRALVAESVPPVDVAAVRGRCAVRIVGDGHTAIRTEQEQHLRFGPRWHNLRRIYLGAGESLAELELDAAFVSDLEHFELHPALLDLATGHALSTIPDYDGRSLYVPLAYERIRIHAPLQGQIVSHARGRAENRAEREIAVFDVTLASPTGQVLVEIDGFTMRRLQDVGALGRREVTRSRVQLSPAEQVFLDTMALGIGIDEGMSILDRIVSSEPCRELVVSSIPLTQLLERTRQGTAQTKDAGVKFTRPTLHNEYAEPTDDYERTLVEDWQQFLGVDKVGIHDDFFELGGHSLIAVRMFAKIKKTFGVEYPISVLFEAPTVAKCAALLREALGARVQASGKQEPLAGRAARRYIVSMNQAEGSRRPPFFIVSGMFGNVLNLRHLAAHIGADVPVYALQARGLYGDDKPHETFEEMAAAYLEEIREIQPHGPYYLGGFSGGGITAYEMAQQLLRAGERTGLLVMLDSTPPAVPQLLDSDKVKIHLQRLRHQGAGYLAAWAKRRWDWEATKVRRLLGEEPRAQTPAEFRSEQIEMAFRTALAAYEVRPYPGKVLLFRPPLDRTYILGPGRIANKDRELVDPANHWSPYVLGGIEVVTVSGDHDSMVLEPHVRGLAQRLRSYLDGAAVDAPPQFERGLQLAAAHVAE